MYIVKERACKMTKTEAEKQLDKMYLSRLLYGRILFPKKIKTKVKC